MKIAFDRFRYGFMKRRLLEGESEDSDDWRIGHPLLFPTILAVGEAHRPTLQIRTPVDDTHTIQFAYRTTVRPAGAEPRPLAVKRSAPFEDGSKVVADNIPLQDMLAWVGQGPVSQRHKEHLGASDQGVILFHKMLTEEAEKVARGEDPLGLIRDPAENEPMIDIHREGVGYSAFQSKYESYFERVERLADSRAT
ncbi:MAG TPA: hypothetical protein VK009_13685 [Chloroflexota bacterium]|nr:hypothetical protein [Chloroflexota bacterium]